MSSISDALAQAVAQIKQKVDNALAQEVAIEVKADEVWAIWDTVYGAYTPVMYDRRYDAGGLSDPDNMEVNVSGGVLTVTNVTPAADGPGYTTGKNLAQLIEGGNGSGGFYDFPSRGAYMRARPFTEATRELLRNDKTHVEGLRRGLKRQGLKVE